MSSNTKLSKSKNKSDTHSKINSAASSQINKALNGDKKWYKKKSTIIASSSIFGIGALVTAITVPLVLHDQKTQSSIEIISEDIKNAVTAINEKSNKITRIDVWNKYMNFLSTPIIDQNETYLNQFIRSDLFVDEFINFLTNNLSVSTIPTVGSISPDDLEKFKALLNSNKESFKDGLKTIYSNTFFVFNSANAMFIFKDHPTQPTIQFELFMPLIGLDLIYNNSRNAQLEISAPSTTVLENNVRIKFTKFDGSNLAGNTYFFDKKIINFPLQVTKRFPHFFDLEVKSEIEMRNNLNSKFETIKNTITQDASSITGLSYWNGFALNYALSNKTFIENDLSKDIASSGILTFLKNNSSIVESELNEIRNMGIANLNVSNNPYVNSRAYDNIIFKSNKSNANNYQLELRVYNFTYEYTINNLFVGTDAITIKPMLELDGLIVKTASDNATSTYPIPKKLYDASKIINMNLETSLTTGGFLGFFSGLIFSPNDPISMLTENLVTFNNKSIAEQLTFWNQFASTNSQALLAEFKKPNILWDFIFNNIDLNNVYATNPNVPFPITDANIAFTKTEFNKSAANITKPINPDFGFSQQGTAALAMPFFRYGPESQPGTILLADIYFQSESDSIQDMNVISSTTTSNLGVKQELGPALNGSSNNAAMLAANKRISVHFYGQYDSWVFYFGEYKTTDNIGRVSKQILFPNTVLTQATNFLSELQSFAAPKQK